MLWPLGLKPFILARNRVLRTRMPVQLKALACFCLFGLWPKIEDPYSGSTELVEVKLQGIFDCKE